MRFGQKYENSYRHIDMFLVRMLLQVSNVKGYVGSSSLNIPSHDILIWLHF